MRVCVWHAYVCVRVCVCVCDVLQVLIYECHFISLCTPRLLLHCLFTSNCIHTLLPPNLLPFSQSLFEGIYRPKALPSAGLLPFLQTMVCDLHDDPLLEWAENGSFPDMFPDARYVGVCVHACVHVSVACIGSTCTGHSSIYVGEGVTVVVRTCTGFSHVWTWHAYTDKCTRPQANSQHPHNTHLTQSACPYTQTHKYMTHAHDLRH